MQVDINDVLFWMDAIRNSKDRYRTLESFWKGQVNSKIWLINHLEKFVKNKDHNIVIHAGWNGILSSLLFNSNIGIKKIISVDIDSDCESTATIVNQRYVDQKRFLAITENILNFKYTEKPDIVVNTSCEHLTDKQLYEWYSKIPKNTLVVLQSNNFYDCEEHVNCVESIDEFKEKFSLFPLLASKLKTFKYDRFMLIGYKS